MSWAIIPELRGRRAADHWLKRIAPDRQVRVRKKLGENIERLERALAQDGDLLKTLCSVLQDNEFLGRVNGLREGLELYEYALRLQEDNTPAFRAMLKYIVRCAEQCEKEALKQAISAKRVCEYLDREIERIEEQKTSDVMIRPPAKWGCGKWKNALKQRRSSAEKLISLARTEALSQRYCTLMAWKTWGEKGNSRKHKGTGDIRSEEE